MSVVALLCLLLLYWFCPNIMTGDCLYMIDIKQCTRVVLLGFYDSFILLID